MKTFCLVPAAGSGTRMKGNTRKQYLNIDGKPLLAVTLAALAASPEIDGIIVAVPPEDIGFVERQVIAAHSIKKIIVVTAGGATRQESVACAFAALPEDAELVMTHDGARPMVTPQLVRTVIEAAAAKGAATAALPMKDTVRLVENGMLVGEIDREGVWRIQTPQCFRRDLLQQGIDRAVADQFVATDETSLLMRLGIPVTVVPGDEQNIKVTTPDDLALIRAT